MPQTPGDFLLDKYFPEADDETRARALAAFRDFAAFILRLGERMALDEEAVDSTKSTEGAKL